jgi:hypothetical protein
MTEMERQAVLDFMVNHPAAEPKPPESPHWTATPSWTPNRKRRSTI